MIDGDAWLRWLNAQRYRPTTPVLRWIGERISRVDGQEADRG